MRIAMLLMLLLVAGTHGGRAAERPELRMVFFPFPPFNDVDGEGRPQGVLIDRFRRICDAAGFTPRFEGLPAARARQALVKGDADVMLTNNASPDLAGNIVSSAEPIERLTTEAYWVDGTPPVTQLGDLDRQTVIVQLAYAYGGIRDYVNDPRHGITVVGQTTDIAGGIKMLALGRARYLIQYRNNFEAALRALQIDVRFRSGELSSVPLYINVSKRTPDAETVLQRLIEADRKLGTLPPSG